MRTYQIYIHGRPTAMQMTPPGSPLWQGQPITPAAQADQGSALHLTPMQANPQLEPGRAHD